MIKIGDYVARKSHRLDILLKLRKWLKRGTRNSLA